jgi:chromosome segregation ATPase
MSELGSRYIQTLDMMENPDDAAANRFFHQLMKLGRELSGFPAFARKYGECANLEQAIERNRVELDAIASQKENAERQVIDLRENVGALQSEFDELTVAVSTEGEQRRAENRQECAEALRNAKRAAEGIILEAHASAAAIAAELDERVRAQQAVIDNMKSERAHLEADIASLGDRRADMEAQIAELRKRFGG